MYFFRGLPIPKFLTYICIYNSGMIRENIHVLLAINMKNCLFTHLFITDYYMYSFKGLPIPRFLTYICIYVLFRDDKGEYTCTAGNEYEELSTYPYRYP